MEFTTIYRNGKPQYFFIKIDEPAEFNFLQPYFLVTSLASDVHKATYKTVSSSRIDTTAFKKGFSVYG